MDSFFFRGRPFRLGAGTKENSDGEKIHLGGKACADAALFRQTLSVFLWPTFGEVSCSALKTILMLYLRTEDI